MFAKLLLCVWHNTEKLVLNGPISHHGNYNFEGAYYVPQVSSFPHNRIIQALHMAVIVLTSLYCKYLFTQKVFHLLFWAQESFIECHIFFLSKCGLLKNFYFFIFPSVVCSSVFPSPFRC